MGNDKTQYLLIDCLYIETIIKFGLPECSLELMRETFHLKYVEITWVSFDALL